MPQPDYVTRKDIESLIARLVAVETLDEKFGDRYIEIQKEIVRIDEGVKGVRAQAVAHNETSKKALSEVKNQIDTTTKHIETLVSNSCRELQDTLDKIINVLGIDSDPHAGKNLSTNLAFLNSVRIGREESISWIRRGIIGIFLSALAAVMIAGVTAIVSHMR